MRIGNGFDAHTFADGRKLVLGGIDIPHPRGLEGHSDADALLHAVIDALLGAAALGDIGALFPSSDTRWQGASSLDLLGRAHEVVRAHGFAVVNIDCTVIAQEPKLAPHIQAMRQAIAAALGGNEFSPATAARRRGLCAGRIRQHSGRGPRQTCAVELFVG